MSKHNYIRAFIDTSSLGNFHADRGMLTLDGICMQIFSAHKKLVEHLLVLLFGSGAKFCRMKFF